MNILLCGKIPSQRSGTNPGQVQIGSCQGYTFRNIKEDAQKTSEKIADLTYDSDPNTRLFIPDFAAASKDNLDKYQLETDELYAELKAILDGKAN